MSSEVVLSTMGNGEATYAMALVCSSGQMEQDTKASGRTIVLKGEVDFCIVMAISMLVNGDPM